MEKSSKNKIKKNRKIPILKTSLIKNRIININRNKNNVTNNINNDLIIGSFIVNNKDNYNNNKIFKKSTFKIRNEDIKQNNKILPLIKTENKANTITQNKLIKNPLIQENKNYSHGTILSKLEFSDYISSKETRETNQYQTKNKISILYEIENKIILIQRAFRNYIKNKKIKKDNKIINTSSNKSLDAEFNSFNSSMNDSLINKELKELSLLSNNEDELLNDSI